MRTSNNKSPNNAIDADVQKRGSYDPWVAILNVRAGEGDAFEQAFSQAQSSISSMPGYVSNQLQRCLESQDKYILLIQWLRLEDHTIGVRQSRQYQDWKKLLHDFYVKPM